ncbi:hypothetical protein K474DRAFT_1591668 [Panus rudis PR-1116 ss-1]|nr:hypothetical protein K474DRAFT_1591668 [Panus rudis PR-1116 ss-1]
MHSDPPHYVLVSHSSSLNNQSVPTTFSHPIVEYHYADDSPRNLLPRSPDEQVLILDYPEQAAPTAKSLSPDVAVTGVKVTDAPGAAGHEGGPKNNKIYVLDTTTLPEEVIDEDTLHAPYAILARFKQRYVC